VSAIATRARGLLLAGPLLRDDASGEVFEVEVAGHDPRLEQAFAIAGRGSLTEADLRAIAAHQHTLYVTGKGGSVDRARLMLRVGTQLLDAQGIAVKVESSGTAHSASRWRELAALGSEAALYHAYVTLVTSRQGLYSCGMHAVGLSDALTQAENASRVVDGFLLYTLIDRPTLADGETFSLGAGEAVYRVRHIPDERFPPDDPFHNPYGLWLLEQAAPGASQ
jgi:hypothetical protein